ncbi:hypothetical protein [Nocardia panacis]|uniref:hypothetical protein n=1 Tax=Nocardia panacis TaxID=2340916 RepID=UPI0013153911|nr:hypothetical protein [Nocardia panacis]
MGADTSHTKLACYSGAGFMPALTEAAEQNEVSLIGLNELYEPVPGNTNPPAKDDLSQH